MSLQTHEGFIYLTCFLFFQIFLQVSKVNASLFKIKFLVPLTNRPQHTTWISHSNNIGRNILCYNTASADDYIVSNLYPGKDDCAGTNPAVFADRNRHVVLIAFFPQGREDGVPCRSDDDPRPKHSVVSNIDVGIVHKVRLKFA